MHTPEALVRSHVVYNAKVQFETYFLFVPVVLSASSVCTTQKGVGTGPMLQMHTVYTMYVHA